MIQPTDKAVGTRRRLLGSLLALALCSSASVRAQELTPASSTAGELASADALASRDVLARQRRYRAIAARIEQALAAGGVPGGALAIVEGNRLRFATGIGVKQASGSERVDADTRFRIGSITKTFTSALAVQLAAEHVVSLDAPITRYLPELSLAAPYDERRITLRMLLSHTSGIPDHAEFACDTDEEALSRWFADHPDLTLWTPPGRLHSYSNLGYSLAGLVLERAAGAPYRQLVEELILEPLGLDSMTYEVAEALAVNHASGFSPGFELEPESMECALTDPPGFLWSSARDLARFASTLLRGGDGVLDPRGIRQMRAPQTPTDPSGRTTYGLGLLNLTIRGAHVVGHNGGMPGYRSSMWLVPASDLAIVLLLNGDAVDPDALALEAMAELLALPVEPPVDLTTPPSEWVDYLGHYEEQQAPTAFPEPWIGSVYVDMEGEQLFIRDESGSERIPLQQLAGDVWLAQLEPGVELLITFWRDRRGKVDFISSRSGAVRRVGDLP